MQILKYHPSYSFNTDICVRNLLNLKGYVFMIQYAERMKHPEGSNLY